MDQTEAFVIGHVGHAGMHVSTSAASLSVPYVEADFLVDRSLEPHLVQAGLMAKYVVQIVQTEGPVHQDEIVTRIRLLWGLGRAGSRIRNAVVMAIRFAASEAMKIGRAHVWTPVTNAHLVCRLLLEKKKK